VSEPCSRVVLVTGVSSGIGRAIVLAALGRGHRVAGCARRKDRLEDLRQAAAAAGHGGDRLHLAVADVNREAETDAWIAGTEAVFGRIDALINNAGYGHGGAVEALTVDDYREQFETNFFALVRLTRQLIPILARGGGGDIVMISSIVGLIALPGRSAYCASKWAVEGFSEALRGEVRRHGIRVSVVNPGFTESEFAQAMKVRGTPPPKRLDLAMSAEAVAAAVVGCLGRERRNVKLTWLGKLAVLLHTVAPGVLDRIGERRFVKEMAEAPAAASAGNGS
jgi:NAD(P)-dependent dehydrogenase (short-subunit alcohol dehydrogenase family)